MEWNRGISVFFSSYMLWENALMLLPNWLPDIEKRISFRTQVNERLRQMSIFSLKCIHIYIYIYIYIFFFFFFCGAEVWTQRFVLARQAYYSSSHTFSPLFSGYFGDRFSLFCSGQAGFSYFMLSAIAGWQVGHHTNFCFPTVEIGCVCVCEFPHKIFLPGVIWSYDPLDLSLLRQMTGAPLHPAIGWDKVSWTTQWLA
jgi:hypothetical protein